MLTPAGFCLEATKRLWNARKTKTIELTSQEIDEALLAVEHINNILNILVGKNNSKVNARSIISELKDDVEEILGSDFGEELDILFNNALEEVMEG